MSQMNYQSYVVSEKLKMIAFAKKSSNRAAEQEFGISECNMQRWRKIKEKLKFECTSCQSVLTSKSNFVCEKWIPQGQTKTMYNGKTQHQIFPNTRLSSLDGQWNHIHKHTTQNFGVAAKLMMTSSAVKWSCMLKCDPMKTNKKIRSSMHFLTLSSCRVITIKWFRWTIGNAFKCCDSNLALMSNMASAIPFQDVAVKQDRENFSNFQVLWKKIWPKKCFHSSTVSVWLY